MLVHKEIEIKKVMIGNKQFVKVSNLWDDEEGKNSTFFKPVVCFFCRKPITKFEGKDPDAIVIHSLDNNHDNWSPENKTPAHRGCHSKFHSSGEKNPMFGVDRSGKNNPFFGKTHKPESVEKMRLVKLGERNPMFGKHPSPEHRKKLRLAKLGKALSKETKKKIKNSNKKFWDNTTPEQRAEHGRQTIEGTKRAKLRREKNEF